MAILLIWPGQFIHVNSAIGIFAPSVGLRAFIDCRLKGLNKLCPECFFFGGDLGHNALIAVLGISWHRISTMALQNGLYRAVTTGFDLPYSIMVRIDIDPPAGSKRYVSIDLYRGFMLPDTDPDQSPTPSDLVYLGSFRTEPVGPVDPGQDELTFELGWLAPLAFDISKPTVQLTFKLDPGPDPAHPAYALHYQVLVPTTAVPMGPLDLVATPVVPMGSPDPVATPVGPFFHEVVLTVDSTPGLPKPYAIPADPDASRPGFVECFRRAGISIVGPGLDDDLLPLREFWTMDDLVTQEKAKSDANIPGWSLNVYLMIATRLSGSPDTLGIMFDKPRRAAAAVFYNSLSAYFGGAGREFELATNYLFTCVHEVGHCLNLPHAFEDLHLPSLSSDIATFMTYAQLYSGQGGTIDKQKFQGATGWDSDQTGRYLNFWAAFGYAFHPMELLQLRHGSRKDVVTGSGVSEYRGLFSGPGSSLSVGGDAGTGLDLTLRFRGPGREGVQTASDRTDPEADEDVVPRAIFEFGEPIHVEAELRNYLKSIRYLSRRLSPSTGDLQIHYQTPDNKFLSYRPPCNICYVPTTKQLGGAKRRDGRNSFHKDICLNIGSTSFQFLTPGLYRVRASYQYRDTQLVSNVLEVYVRHPARRVENLVVPLLGEDLATYLAFRGVSGLEKLRGRLQDRFLDTKGAARRTARHPLQYYFHAYEAFLRAANPAANNTEKDDQVVFANALGLGKLTDLTDRNLSPHVNLAHLPFSNIMLSKLATRIWSVLNDRHGSTALASALTDKLNDALTTRGVPSVIRGRVSRVGRNE